MDKLRELEEYIKCDDVNNDELWDIYWKLKKSLEIPKHETVQQWEKRTGETYLDSAPCYILDEGKYHLMTYAFGKDYFPHSIFVVNHHGKPQ